MDTSNLPRYLLRDELMRVLAVHAERFKRERLPVLPPRGVLEMLNEFGPRLDDRWIPMVEATLDGLWSDGLVGRMPAASASHAKGYCSRRAAERAILLGAPVILMPLKIASRHRRPLRDRVGREERTREIAPPSGHAGKLSRSRGDRHEHPGPPQLPLF